MLDISPHHDALKRLRDDAQTEGFRAMYRMRKAVIEGVFGEAKQWHGLRRAARRGLANMLIQSLLVAAVLNFKRLMAASSPLNGWTITILGMWRSVSQYVSAIGRVQLFQTITNPTVRIDA